VDTGDTVGTAAGPAGRPWKQAAGYLIGAACLLWVFHDIHVERMFAYIGAMNWWWVIPAVAFDILSYVCEGIRWHHLLRPAGGLPVLRATEAVYIGLFTNEVTPMRLGELVRTYLASRWMKTPVSKVVPSMLVSRLLDVIWLALGFGVLAIFVPLPGDLLLAGDLLGAGVVVLVFAFLAFLVAEPAVVSRWAVHGRPPRGRLGSVKSTIGRIGEGLLQIGTFRRLFLPAIISLGIPGFQALSFWLVMQAYHLRLPFLAGAAAYWIVRFGTSIPNAPANVGSYQFFTVLALGLFGADKTAATGFSIVVFLILTLPLWALGLLALSRSGLTLAAIRADLRRISRPADSSEIPPLDPGPVF
jgi:uncharacterized protein (TIRG00374 family)